MSDLTVLLFTLSLLLLSTGLVMRWQERRHARFNQDAGAADE